VLPCCVFTVSCGCCVEVSEKLKTLPHTLPQLLHVVLTRLEEDLGEDGLVATALSLLVSTRNGRFTSPGVCSTCAFLHLVSGIIHIQSKTMN